MMIAAMTFAACDDTTENIGGSITNNVDNINISNAVYDVTTNSLVAGPVLNRSNSGLIGKVKDPETGTYVSGDYMSQFGVLPNFNIDTCSISRMPTVAESKQTLATCSSLTGAHTAIPSPQ